MTSLISSLLFRCLVAKGYAQKHGIDYDEIFLPVVRFSSMRFLLAFAVQHDFLIHQMEVETGFLNGKLNEEIYMQQPEGYVKPGEEHLVCKLEKSLYGLKQSSRCWNKAFRESVEKVSFTQASADPCIFIRKKDTLTIIAIHVDDLMILAENILEMQRLQDSLKVQFKMKDMGELHYYVGVCIVQDKEREQVYLHQGQYIEKMLKKFAQTEAKFGVHACYSGYHISLTNKRAVVMLPYYMHGQVLEHVTSYDYLGVRLTSKLNWKEHCDKTSNKANRSLGLVKRTLKPCTPEVKERAYKALIRPLLEYASAAWNPHTNRETETIEKVKRRAARFVAHDYMRSTNSQDLVNQLGWDSLESRLLLAQVTLFYKIKNNLIDLEFPSSIQPAPRSRIQHAMLQPYSSVLAHSYSPFVRTVRVWNKLSTQTVQAKNITSFKLLAMWDIQNMKTPNHLKRL